LSNSLILASQSPRRQALLKQVGIPFRSQPSNVDESLITTNNPIEKVKELAKLKGNTVSLTKEEVVLTADTVVSYQGQIFEKPSHENDAYQMISMLSGEFHDVYTGVSIRSSAKEINFAVQTKVEFWSLSSEFINWYVKTTEPYDKAGAYGIQSLGALFVKQIIGDYYNVVGLPLSRVVRELQDVDIYPEK
jgi:septum formation protein